MDKSKILMGVVGLAVLGATFYGGVVYGKTNARGSVREFGNIQFTANGQGGRTGTARVGGGFVAGEIVAADASSITVKMPDGSSKIVLVATSTQISKTAEGSAADLTVGEQVGVSGPTNSDGSVTAQMVQIRPAGMGAGTVFFSGRATTGQQ